MLRELAEQAQLADDLGYDSISFTEHHFHVEGFEISNNPVLLDLFIGLQTKRIRVGQLGIVLPAAEPAPRGRGHRHARPHDRRARQRRLRARLPAPLGRRHGPADARHPRRARRHQHDEIDQANRAAFEEYFQIIKRAWTEDMLDYDGQFWHVPPDGTPWDARGHPPWGAGVAKTASCAQVGVVPKPLQKPHPPLFQPFASSENTIRWCAREGVTAILPPMYLQLQSTLYDIYHEEAAAAGVRWRRARGSACYAT